MMYEFLINNRVNLSQRCKEKVLARSGRGATAIQLQNGIPMFLDQLIRTLQIEYNQDPEGSMGISGSSDGLIGFSEVGISAAKHGKALLALGFSIDQVVHDYGDLCQSITDLAVERDAPFRVDEFRTLNRCLDNAIAEAVTEFTYQRELIFLEKHAREMGECSRDFAHNLRDVLGTASLAFSAVKSGNLSLTGSTGAILERSLLAISKLIEGSLNAGLKQGDEQDILNSFSLEKFVSDVVVATKEAMQTDGFSILVPHIDPDLAVRGIRKILLASVVVFLVGIIDSIGTGAEVKLCAYASGDMVRIDVLDHSGFLSKNITKIVSVPYKVVERESDVDDFLNNQAIFQCGGVVNVYDVPRVGRVFSIRLPRFSMPS